MARISVDVLGNASVVAHLSQIIVRDNALNSRVDGAYRKLDSVTLNGTKSNLPLETPVAAKS